MSIEMIKQQLPDFAKDIRLNLSNLFSNIEQTGLAPVQFYGVALAVAYSLKNSSLIEAIQAEVGSDYQPELEEAAKTAATLMAMNNVYYRFIHLVEDKEFASMPAQLRMNGLNTHGVDKLDFELYALAVSSINGCGLCMASHTRQLVQHGLSRKAIQSVIRLAAVLNAASQAMAIA
ncbi:carboxymuconolactone decarboxylase family protein [Legionella israelensis]|uniref:Alkyl hydroperoxide reductase AhpD n=1 Tax=Legionella israelensis TaxID=454 RepID=A0A0W0V4I7_9GAMM|nr:carboxymuconolactone decarboxylase family protein [Legionella israelensis]KTD15038.1 alkyl hydroperoxide reductase [Legionella israelensis]QBS10210.1 alkyl hydroperoxide reductase [Legionella israelensis]SCY20497.1 alkyl hydroperoxide reductase subunit D [Legionella israelensis DSM 19235]STX59803.1 alkyl hydroperoxide reductase [Legionella israelensis]